MSYVRKTTRLTWAYPQKTLRAMATLAAKTSMQHAADTFRVNWNTVRRACQVTGIAPRRRQSNVYAKLRALQLRANGKTYTAIAQAVGYSRQSIYNWCAEAGVIVDCRRKAA